MKLGDYVQVNVACRDPEKSAGFYERLGWKRLDDTTFTDGNVNLHLAERDTPSPSLAYYGSDLSALAAEFPEPKRKRGDVPPKPKGEPTGRGLLTAPSGLKIQLDERKHKLPMPEGTPTRRTMQSPLGKLGEFTQPVKALPDAILFWSKLGYEPLHIAQIPYPYAILSDGLIVIGLHQQHQVVRALTYFAPDMGQRIQSLREAGFKIQPMMQADDGRIDNAAIETPEGLILLLFKGDVFN